MTASPGRLTVSANAPPGYLIKGDANIVGVTLFEKERGPLITGPPSVDDGEVFHGGDLMPASAMLPLPRAFVV